MASCRGFANNYTGHKAKTFNSDLHEYIVNIKNIPVKSLKYWTYGFIRQTRLKQ